MLKISLKHLIFLVALIWPIFAENRTCSDGLTAAEILCKNKTSKFVCPTAYDGECQLIQGQNFCCPVKNRRFNRVRGDPKRQNSLENFAKIAELAENAIEKPKLEGNEQKNNVSKLSGQLGETRKNATSTTKDKAKLIETTNLNKNLPKIGDNSRKNLKDNNRINAKNDTRSPEIETEVSKKNASNVIKTDLKKAIERIDGKNNAKKFENSEIEIAKKNASIVKRNDSKRVLNKAERKNGPKSLETLKTEASKKNVSMVRRTNSRKDPQNSSQKSTTGGKSRYFNVPAFLTGNFSGNQSTKVEEAKNQLPSIETLDSPNIYLSASSLLSPLALEEILVTTDILLPKISQNKPEEMVISLSKNIIRGTCFDRYIYCAEFRSLCTHPTFEIVMAQKCALTCDRCFPPPENTTNGSECFDLSSECVDNVNLCESPLHRDTMHKMCPKSCKICTPFCKDRHDNCPTYKAEGFCENQLYTWEERQYLCGETCGICEIKNVEIGKIGRKLKKIV